MRAGGTVELKPQNILYEISKHSLMKKLNISCIYFVIVITFAIILPILRNLNKYIIICLIPSVAWSLFGPRIIVKYYNNFMFLVEKLSSNELLCKGIQDIFEIDFKINAIISIGWVIPLNSLLLIFPNSLEFLYIYGYKDPLYWFFLIFAFYLSYLTATGLSGTLSCLRLMFILDQKDENNNSYIIELLNQDKEIVKMLTNFSFTTSKYFSTGICFIPILLVYMNHSNSFLVHIIISVSILLYSSFIFLSYSIPIHIIRKNIKQHKTDKISMIKDKYDNAVLNCEHIDVISFYLQIQQIKDDIIISEVLEQTLKILVASLLPILLFIIDHVSFLQSIIIFFKSI